MNKIRVLFIHNRYKERGGEDVVYEAEKHLLSTMGHQIEELLFDNEVFDIDNSIITKAIKTVFNWDSVKEVENKIKEFNPDIIHAHNLFYVASPSVVYAANKANIPIIVTLHNYRLICIGGQLMLNGKPCERCINKKFSLEGVKNKCFQNSYINSMQLSLIIGIHNTIGTWNSKVSGFIALTDFTKNKIINSSIRIETNKVFVKPNFVFKSEIPIQKHHKRNNSFLFVGRLSKEKGIEILLEAFRNSEFELDIIGDGPLRNIVENYTSLCSNIKFYGFREKETIMEKLRYCRALVFPSIWYEGLPTIILESFSVGTPVIASDIENIRDIVKNWYNGVHFRYGDERDLMKKIRMFILNENKIDLYKNAFDTYEELYTPTVAYNNIIKIYTNLLINNAKNK